MSYNITLPCGCLVYVSCHPQTGVAVAEGEQGSENASYVEPRSELPADRSLMPAIVHSLVPQEQLRRLSFHLEHEAVLAAGKPADDLLSSPPSIFTSRSQAREVRHVAARCSRRTAGRFEDTIEPARENPQKRRADTARFALRSKS